MNTKTPKWKWRIVIGLLLLTTGATAIASTSSPSTANTDIRILIDVSGSMKKNDPHNLRQPALRMLANLLPNNSRAGVWTFGRYVNMLVPINTVNRKWKQQATQASNEIASHGLYTNLEDTLQDATWDWNKPANGQQRSLILLTDGLVDISKDPARDAASRKRILNKILPMLAKNDVHIYTIALSNDADTPLLQQLADKTGGWFEQAQTAEQLERLFLHMFEKAAKPDTVPLKQDNTFSVDQSISEMTLLVFRKANSPITKLIHPKQTMITKDDLPDNVFWHHEANFDLITIEKPETGRWQILADTDPDNRVTVITDLKMSTPAIPANILLGDAIIINSAFTHKDKPLTQKNILDLITVEIFQTTAEEKHHHWTLGADDKLAGGPGRYTKTLQQTLRLGQHQITVHADGITFERSAHLSTRVHSAPATASVKINEQTNTVTLTVLPIISLIHPKTVTVTARISHADHSNDYTLSSNTQHEWRLDLVDLKADTNYLIEVQISGRRPSGKPITASLEKIEYSTKTGVQTPHNNSKPHTESLSDASADHNPGANHTPSMQAKTDSSDHSLASPPEHSEESGDHDSEFQWKFIAIQVVIFNLVVFIIGFIAYRKWKKSLNTSDQSLEALQEQTTGNDASTNSDTATSDPGKDSSQSNSADTPNPDNNEANNNA